MSRWHPIRCALGGLYRGKVGSEVGEGEVSEAPVAIDPSGRVRSGAAWRRLPRDLPDRVAR